MGLQGQEGGLTRDHSMDLVGLCQLGREERKNGRSELHQVFIGRALFVSIITVYHVIR